MGRKTLCCSSDCPLLPLQAGSFRLFEDDSLKSPYRQRASSSRIYSPAYRPYCLDVLKEMVYTKISSLPVNSETPSICLNALHHTAPPSVCIALGDKFIYRVVTATDLNVNAAVDQHGETQLPS
ncbi:UNVERIFIED_CONTAM: hypothetical protein FKN15_012968 [Acipenser sinensis]